MRQHPGSPEAYAVRAAGAADLRSSLEDGTAVGTQRVALVTDGDRVRGPTDAAVTIVEYGDFECPTCKQAAAAVRLLLARFAGRVRFVFRHFPLEAVHSQALVAAEAAEAAANQGRFWEMHDLLFVHQPHFQPQDLRDLARVLELDLDRFSEELSEHVHLARIREDIRRGRLVGLRSSPTFRVNGDVCDVSFGIERLRRMASDALVRAAVREANHS